MRRLALLGVVALALTGCVKPLGASGGFALALGYRNVHTTHVADGTPTMPKQACGEGGLYAFTADNGAGLICVYGGQRAVVIAQTGIRAR